MTNKQIIDYKQKSDSGRKGGFSNAKRVKEKITKEYYENPNYCKNCGKIIELNNMRAICPNCNSQTETFGGRGIKPLHIEKRPISNINRQRKLHPSVG
jgi:rubrerythrin